MFSTVFLALCALAFASANPLGSVQSSGAEGRLLCNGKPLAGVLIKLYDNDSLDKDDLMAKTKTDSNGYFRLAGKEREVTPIDPKINIYHHCGDVIPRCSRKISIAIPDSYITNGPVAQRYFNIGTMELVGKVKGEERDCIH